MWEIGWVRRLRRRWRLPLQIPLGPLLASYIKLVIKSSRVTAVPPSYVEQEGTLHPYILALWHGQTLLVPGLHAPDVPARVMVARHDDAEGLAEAIRQFGLGLIRGAGAGGRSGDRGGAAAARGALTSLRDGFSVGMTADAPPGPARKCGLGIVRISSLSGRPIIPFAVASSHYRSLNTWSRMTINLPFSKLGVVMGDPIFVPRRVSRNELEHWRQCVESALNDVTARAYATAGVDMARATPAPTVPATARPSPEMLFEPLSYQVAALASLGLEPLEDFSVEDIVFLGKCLALRQSRSDLSALRLWLFGDVGAWAKLLSLAEVTRLFAAVAEQLQSRQLVPPEPPAAGDGEYSPATILRARLATHRARRAAQRERLMEIVAALNVEGIEPLLIKGAHSLWTGAPDWRYQIDLDLLVAADEAAAAQAALIALGYEQPPDYPRRDRRHHLDPLLRDDLPGCVEIHRRAGNRYAEPLLPTPELFGESVPSTIEGARARLLPEPLHILQSLIHHHVGHSADARGLIHLKGLYEFAWAFDKLDPTGQAALEVRAAKHVRVAAALDLWIAAAADLFAMPIPEPFRVHADATARWSRVLARMGGGLRPGWKYPGYSEEIQMAFNPERMRGTRPATSFIGRQILRLQIIGSLLPKSPF